MTGENNIKECFVFFGRIIYVAQTVEKGILNSLISSYPNLTKTRYDELYAEKSQLTFGQLKREIIGRDIFEKEIIEKLEEFHIKRDWLVHNYWWDRAIEFYRDDLRYKIFEELDEIRKDFDSLNEIVSKKNNWFLNGYGVDLEKELEDFSKLDKTPKHKGSRKLSKSETLVGIYLYMITPNFKIPIFQLKDGSFWTLSESGLTSFITEVEPGKFLPMDELDGIFPVMQFNPISKTKNDWNYELDLKKKGLYIKVQPYEVDGKFVYKWGIKVKRK